MARGLSGISKQKCLSPLLLFGFALVVLGYLNNEILLPKTYHLNPDKEDRFTLSKEYPFELIHLKDGSLLTFMENKGLKDLYWIKGSDEIIHAKEGSWVENELRLKYVDHIKEGKLESSYEKMTLSLPPMLSKEISSPTSISELIRAHHVKDGAFVSTMLNYRLFNPWLPMITLLAAITIVFSFDMKGEKWPIFIAGGFFFLCFFSIIKTCMILGENYYAPPELLAGLIVLLLGVGAWKYRTI